MIVFRVWRTIYIYSYKLLWLLVDPVANSIRFNLIYIHEASFGEKKWTDRTVSTPTLVISFALPSCMHLFEKVSSVLGFHTTP